MSDPLRFLLLGDPVEHSRSPQIHRAALASLALEGTYETLTADEPALHQAIEDLRHERITGINITMPLKNAAARACDLLTDEARSPMSANTLRLRSQLVEGHSTDVAAVREVLGREGLNGNTPILILGAGGAAAAVVAAAKARHIYVSSRDPNKGAELIRGSDDAAVIPFGAPVAGAVVINATPIGMNRESLPAGIIEVGSGLVDLAYGQSETPAVAKARNLGIPTVDGIDFLVIQAAASFEWWTGEDAPLNSMLNTARKN